MMGAKMAITMVITRRAKVLSANCPETYIVDLIHSVAFDAPSTERLDRSKRMACNNPAKFIS